MRVWLAVHCGDASPKAFTNTSPETAWHPGIPPQTKGGHPRAAIQGARMGKRFITDFTDRTDERVSLLKIIRAIREIRGFLAVPTVEFRSGFNLSV